MKEDDPRAASPRVSESGAVTRDIKHGSIAELFHGEATTWVVLAISFALTVLAWNISNEYVNKRASDRFGFEVERAQLAVAKRMQEYEQVLRGGVGLFNVSNDVTRSEWRAYVETLRVERYWPGIQGVGFSRWMTSNQKDAVVARIRAEGYPEFDVVPPGRRETYTAIVYLEPPSGRNSRAFGFDMFSEPTRRAAMEAARDTGAATVSGRVTLVQETDTDVQAGFLMYVPVYRTRMPDATVDERRAALFGFVYSPFRVNNLFEEILGSGAQDLHFQIFDGVELGAERLLYESTPGLADADSLSAPKFTTTRVIELPGRTWTARYRSTAGFDEKMNSSQPRLVAIAGALVDLLLLMIILSLRRQRRRVQTSTRSSRLHSETRLRRLIEAMPGAMFVVDSGGKTRMVNARAAKLFGYEIDELLGQPIEMLVPACFSDAHHGHGARFIAAPAERKTGEDQQLFARRKDGVELPVEVQFNALVEDDERYVLALAIDLSEHRNIKAEIEAERGYLRSILDGLSEGVMICDEHDTIVCINDALRRLYSRSDMPLPAHGPEGYGMVFPDGTTPVPIDQLPLHRAARGEVVRSMELVIAPPNQPPRNVVVSASPLTLETGVRKGAVAVVRDITERKRAEAELRDTKNDAECANRAKTRFLSDFAHELRTPLGSILGFAQLLAMDKAHDDQYKSGVAKIQAAGEHLLRLFADALDMSHIESGSLRVESRPTHALSILRECDLLAQPLARKHGVRLMFDEGIAAHYELDVDPTRIKQVLLKLISNGVKYNHRGGSVWVRCGATRNDRIRFSVRDNGAGIDENLQQQLFQPFNRLGRERGRTEGTGLGLVISRGLVELMGGRLDFISKLGEGSEFAIEFPARAGAGFIDASGGAARPDVQPLTTRDCVFDCLCIEDNFANVEQISVLIKEYWPRANLLTAASAELGLELAALLRPHLVLMDIDLSGTDGRAALARLRGLPELKDVPVIAMSASDADLRRGAAEDFAEYITKPIYAPTLLAAIDRALTSINAKLVRPGGDLEHEFRPTPSQFTPTPVSARNVVLDPAMTQQLASYLGSRALPFIDALMLDLPALLDSMRRASTHDDLETIRRDAHTIRGNSSNVGATALVGLCVRISAECKAGHLDEVRALIAALQSEFHERVAPAISQLRQQLASHARAV